MRVLVFGDSITQGFWDTEGGWAARLRKHYDLLKLKDLRTEDEKYPDVMNLGISGGNSRTILERFGNEIKPRKTDGLIIIICTGVNDSCVESNARHSTTPEEYEANLNELAQISKRYAAQTLFVGLVACNDSETNPVFWAPVNYSNKRINMYEDIMCKVAAVNELPFVPVHKKFKQKLDEGDKLLADGLHPNDEGHKLIYELVQPKLDKLLVANASGR